jgi:4-hydroxy-tetrahydrodipicolinate reductase
MGQAIVRAIDAADDLQISGVWARGESIDEVVAASDVIIDFSLPGATATVLEAVSNHQKPLVCGVSGLDEALWKAVEQAATVIPLVFDRNMSQGIAVLDDLVRRAAGSLGADFAVEVHETHHIHKVDSPSGTALQLGESIAAARQQETGEDGVQYQVERRGEVPGDHTVIFSSATETLTLGHSVTTRQVFADGALCAARWVVGQPPGLYRMRNVLFDSQ